MGIFDGAYTVESNVLQMPIYQRKEFLQGTKKQCATPKNNDMLLQRYKELNLVDFGTQIFISH